MQDETAIPSLQGIDHIHLPVPDKRRAARWYADYLGFRPVDTLRDWDTPEGPLVLEDAAGSIHLALFERVEYAPLSAVAFRVDGAGFLGWHRYLRDRDLLERCADHTLAWSLYFGDPFGHSHEITSYDYQRIARAMEGG